MIIEKPELVALLVYALAVISLMAWSTRRSGKLAGQIAQIQHESTSNRIAANMADGRIGALVNLLARSPVVARARADQGKLVCVNTNEIDACLRALSLQVKLRNGDVLGAGAPDPELPDWAEPEIPATPPLTRSPGQMTP